MIRFIIIGAVLITLFWYFTSANRLPRRPERISEDFRLAKNKWATGTWTREEAATFLDRLHRDALDGSKRSSDVGLRREATALANEILAWTVDNIR